MKKIIFFVTLVVVLGLCGGCYTQNTGNNDMPASPPPIIPDVPVDDASDPTPVLDNPPPNDVTWISPGKVQVTNFYPGASAEYPVTIHNGNDFATTFSVSYRYPDHVATGYVKPTANAQDWVIIADETPVLAPYETRTVMVVLAMPEGAEVFAPKWEFWVAVMDMSQTGTVKSEMAVRWLIDMRSA